jgi:hypothetical protein
MKFTPKIGVFRTEITVRMRMELNSMIRDDMLRGYYRSLIRVLLLNKETVVVPIYFN